MMTVQIMELILDNTNPVDNVATGVLFFQLLVTAISELSTLYMSIKTQSRLLKVGVCIVPGVFIVAVGIVAPLLFGSFVGGGTKATAMEAIIGIATSSQFLIELLVVVIAFVVVVVLYCLTFRPRWLEWLITFGIEVATVILWLVAVGGLFIEGFPFNLADTAVFPYLVYGFYTLIYKTLLTLVCIIVGIVFKDRMRRNTSAKKYSVEGGNYEAAAIKFLNYRQKSVGFVFLLTLCSLFGILFYAILSDTGLPLQLSSLLQLKVNLLLPLILPVLLLPICIVCIFFSFAPRLAPAFRSLKKHDALELFYVEVVAKHECLSINGMIETEHFTVQQICLICRVRIKPSIVRKF